LEERSQRGIPEKPHEVEQTELQGEDAYHSIDSLRLSSLLTQMLSVFLMTAWIASTKAKSCISQKPKEDIDE